jgi:hypothetical protein
VRHRPGFLPVARGDNIWESWYTRLDSNTGNQRTVPLSGNRKGQFGIRINDQYRICFNWEAKGPTDVEITDYH